jgi:methionyl-tRNA formyltransferase
MESKSKDALRVIFMGTPEFAVDSLDGLLAAGFRIVAVITAPDRAAGRGLRIRESPIKIFARSRGLHLMQPEKLKNPEFLEQLRAVRADLQVVVAFRMLPEQVWNMPEMGTINLHASLLPAYRGAAPINWAIIHGETATGLTTFRLRQEIDQGNILMQEAMEIGKTETAGELHDRMKKAGASLLVRTLEGLLAGAIQEIPQTQKEGILPIAPKITPEICRISWDRPVQKIYDLIRGLSPSPGAFAQLDGKMIKIYRAEIESGNPSSAPGSYETDRKRFLKFAGPDGYILVRTLQMEGKRKMEVSDFLRGYRLS